MAGCVFYSGRRGLSWKQSVCLLSVRELGAYLAAAAIASDTDPPKAQGNITVQPMMLARSRTHHLSNRLLSGISSLRIAAPTHRRYCTAGATVEAKEPPVEEVYPTVGERFKVTGEVCLSKIGPAGAGWWAANAYADQVMGFAATDLGYFCVTGFGDASAVFLGRASQLVSITRPLGSSHRS